MARETLDLPALQAEVIACRTCPRLVAHREVVATRKIKRFADEEYWGRAVPSFGDPQAELLIVGLAPAAHGANRTGRMFTGDRSGEWLYEAMHRYGFANQATSTDREDGLALTNAFITAVVRCAPPGNKPERSEIENCRSYLIRELTALPQLRIVLTLGKIAFDGFLSTWAAQGGELTKPRPKFGHALQYSLTDGPHLIASYHPSQQNTFTGRLTRPMFYDVFREVKKLLDSSGELT